MKAGHSVADPTDGGEEGWLDRRMGGGEPLGRNDQRACIDLGPVNSTGVIEQGYEPLGPNIFTDPFDDLPRRERLAKDINRSLAAGRADHVSLGNKLPAERVETGPAVRIGQVDTGAEGRQGCHGTHRIPTSRSSASGEKMARTAKNGCFFPKKSTLSPRKAHEMGDFRYHEGLVRLSFSFGS